MQEKTKCNKCGLLIDKDSIYCPYCGYKQEDVKEETILNTPIINNEEVKTNSDISLSSRIINYKGKKNLMLFLIGFLFIYLIQTVLSFFFLANTYLLYFTYEASAYLNFSTYFILFGIFIIYLKDDLKDILIDLKKSRTYIYGLIYGLILIIVPTFISSILNIIFNNSSSNTNQETIESILDLFPFLSIIVFGLIGPICEEFTYRLGLFSSLSKKLNIVLTYIISAIIFGLIHFDYTSLTDVTLLKTELINIPSYIVSGFLLCYFYKKEGLVASSIAHISNNMFSLILSLLI